MEGVIIRHEDFRLFPAAGLARPKKTAVRVRVLHGCTTALLHGYLAV